MAGLVLLCLEKQLKERMGAQQISLGYQTPNQEAQAEYQDYDMQQSTSMFWLPYFFSNIASISWSLRTGM